MRLLFGTICIAAALFACFVGFRAWQYHQLWPTASAEVVQLTPEKRALLERLRDEKKFGPNNYPPLGYTGAANPADNARATAAVDEVIASVLARPNGPLQAQVVSRFIGRAMGEGDELETEDRERTQGYLVEIWYLLGFRQATGRFAYGAAFPKPPGYGEPLPPGWTAPDKPRLIGENAGNPSGN